MSRLQRSSVSFRRQGSSGRIWDDPLRGLDLKALSTSTTPKAAAALHPDASFVLAGDPSPRVVSRSLMRHGGCGGGDNGAIVESAEAMAASASPTAAAALHPDASFALAGDPSPRVVSRSLLRHGGCGGGDGAILERSEAAAAAAASVDVVVRADDGERQERRRRRISSAICACMGHPPASHAQQ